MMNIRALPQGPLCGPYQHRTAMSGRSGNRSTSQGPLQCPMDAGHLRMGGVSRQPKDRCALAHARQTQASWVTPVRTKTALRKMRKAELEEEMRRLSLDTQGTKQELVDRLHACLAAQEAKESPEDTPVADKAAGAPEAWLDLQNNGEDLPPDIKALLEQQQAEEDHMGVTQDRGQERLQPESSMIFGSSESPEDLQALPKGAESRRDMQKELQERLAQRGLPKSGNKAELAERLHAALAEEREMVLQDQVEARNELQRQFQESVMNPTSRMEQGDPLDAASGIPEEGFDQWALDIEAEYQSPDDDAELSLEDAEAAGATPGAVRDEEGLVLRGRFNRPRVMMDLFEYQGTKAAELAGEDYAAQRRGGTEHSQVMTGESFASQQRLVTPVDSQDEGDLFHISMADGDAEEEDDDGYENDIENDLEDGFSMAAEQEGDGFDQDVEENSAKEAEGRSTSSSLRASMSEYIGHRNYDSLSSRSPDAIEDAIEEDFGLLDTIISSASGESLPVAKPDLDAANLSKVQTASTTTSSPPHLSRRVPKPQSPKPGQSPAAVVASQGTSSLDYGTAKDWMSTRLPEAMRLGITPDQLVSGAAPLRSQPASADGSNAFSGGSLEAANRPGWGRAGKVEDEEHASSRSEAPEAQRQAEPVVETEPADTEEAAADVMAFHLDNDLLDELAEDVLGQPDASPDDAAAVQLTSMMSGVQQELDAAEAVTDAAPVSRAGSNTLESPNVPAELGMQAETEFGKTSASPEQSVLIDGGEDAAAGPEAAGPLPEGSEVLAAGGAELVSVQGDQEPSSAGLTLDEQDAEPAQFPAQLLSDEVIDSAVDAAAGASDSCSEDQIADKTDLPAKPVVTETHLGSALTPEMQDTIVPSEQLENAMDENSEAMASGTTSPSHPTPPDAPLEPQGTESAGNGLSDDHRIPADTADAEPSRHRSAVVFNGLAEAQSAEAFSEGQPTLAEDQQELAALRDEMAQKQGALAALQSQVAAVGRSNEGNTAQIAQLQVAMASLQSQRLDLQRANLSGRLAVLQDIAAQASLNAAAKDDLQQQLQSMQDELTQLETDLSSRDTEAAELSRKLAHARTRLGDPDAAPPANGTARASVAGEMRARLGNNDDLKSGGQHTLQQDNAPAQQSAVGTFSESQSGAEKMKMSPTQPGVVVAAGLLGAFKAIGGMFRRTKRDD